MKVWIAVVVMLLALYAFLATTSIAEPVFYAMGIAIAVLVFVLGCHYGSEERMWAHAEEKRAQREGRDR